MFYIVGDCTVKSLTELDNCYIGDVYTTDVYDKKVKMTIVYIDKAKEFIDNNDIMGKSITILDGTLYCSYNRAYKVLEKKIRAKKICYTKDVTEDTEFTIY